MCGTRLKNGWFLLGLLLLALPVYLQAGDYDNLNRKELINLVESLEKELIPADNKTIELESNLEKAENDLALAQDMLTKAESSQKKLADTYQMLAKSYEKLSKSLDQGLSLGIDAGVIAVPGSTGKLQLGFYAGVNLQF